MLTQERQNIILEILNQNKAVTVIELTKMLDASESTIRRDLITLHEMAKLKKVHGGATVLDNDFSAYEQDVLTKSLLNVAEKEVIGKYAASLIKNEDFIFIDAGTTTEKLIEYITNTKAIFVTNGIVHAKKLLQKGCKVYLIGGELRLATEALVGTDGVNSMKKYNFTKCFLGTNGVSLQQGYTTPDLEEAVVKREASERSFMSYVLADHTKFDKYSSVTFANIDQASIITDREPAQKYMEVTVIKAVKGGV